MWKVVLENISMMVFPLSLCFLHDESYTFFQEINKQVKILLSTLYDLINVHSKHLIDISVCDLIYLCESVGFSKVFCCQTMKLPSMSWMADSNVVALDLSLSVKNIKLMNPVN